MSDSNDTADVDLPPSPVSSGRRATTPSRPSGVPRISSRAVEGGTLACRRCHHRKKKVSESGGPLRTIPAYPPCLVESSVTEHHISVIARNRIVVVASRAGWNACTTSSSRTSRIPSKWDQADQDGEDTKLIRDTPPCVVQLHHRPSHGDYRAARAHRLPRTPTCFPRVVQSRIRVSLRVRPRQARPAG